MPQLKPLTLNNGVDTESYSINGNSQGVVSWVKPGDTQRGNETLVVAKREARANQTTRKSTVTLTVPLTALCPTTCVVTSRGSVLAKLELISSVESTQAERERALALLSSAIANADIKVALYNNESFWS